MRGLPRGESFPPAPPPRGGLKDPNYRDWLNRTNPFWKWFHEERPYEEKRKRQREMYENSPEG
jgi:hypothetical protein